MADVVAVFFVEGVVRNQSKRLPPEDETVLHRQTKSLEEQGVLKAAEVLEMTVFPKGHVEIAHTERKVLG